MVMLIPFLKCHYLVIVYCDESIKNAAIEMT